MSSGDRGSNRYQEILDLYEAFEQSVPQQGNGYISSTSDFQPNISNNGHEGISSASRLFAAFLDTQRPSPSRHLFHVPSVADVMLSRPSYSSADAVSVNTSSSSSTACVYLCGNSLGLQPVETRTLINQELDVWAKRGVIGHFDHPHNRPWALIDNCVLDESARIVGAKDRSEVAIMNTLTSNLHFLLISFYTPTPVRYKILMEAKAFPSDYFALESQVKFHGYDPAEAIIQLAPRDGEYNLRTEDILDVIAKQGDSIATVIFSGIQYYTGQLFEMEKITRAGIAKGCRVGFDLAHAVGNAEIKLHEWGVDFACWCTYKYLNSGPGNIGGAFVHSKHNDNSANLPRLSGWWGTDPKTKFDMSLSFNPVAGAASYRLSNPCVLSVIALHASLKVFSMSSMSELRQRSALLTGYLDFLLHTVKVGNNNETIVPGFITIMTPSNPEERGCQLSLKFPSRSVISTSSKSIMMHVFDELGREGVIVDERKPDVIRVAPTPLYNTFMDVWKCVNVIARALSSGFSTSDLLLVSSNKRTQGGVVENGAGSMNTKRAKSSTTKLMDSLLKPKLISTSTRADMQQKTKKLLEQQQQSSQTGARNNNNNSMITSRPILTSIANSKRDNFIENQEMISRHQEKGKDVVGDEGAQVMDEDDNHANSNETTIIPEIDHCINQHEPITSTTTPKIHPSSSNPLVSLTSALLHPLVSLSLQQQQTNWKVNTSDHTVLPMDHSIKSGALFSSQDPAIIECLATLDINSVGSQMKQVGIQDYQQDIIDKLSYHVYPALPPSPNQAAALAKIFSKLETERLNRLSSSLSSSSSSSSAVSSTTSTTADIAYGENVLADDQRLEYTHYKKMEAEWSWAFRSLFMAYQNNRLDLPCFYYKNSEFTVQFRHMIIGGHDNQHLEEPLAILTSSSSGLRKLLSIKGIEYSIVSSSNKVKISKNVNRLLAVERQAEEEGKEVVEGSKEKERTIGQEFQATVADGNVLGNDNSTMATIPTDNIVVANTDNTKPSFSSSAQSTQQPTGTVSIQFLGQEHIEKLFFFLLNEWREPRVDMRASRGLPQLISTGPFVNSTWKLIHMSVGKSITTEKSSASMKNMYIVNLSGLLLHSHISHVLDTLTGSYLMKSSSVLDGDLFAWEDSHMFNIKEPNSITPEEAVTVKRIAAIPMPGLEKRFERFLSSSSSSHTLELLAENVDDEVAQEILHEEAGVLRLQNDSGMGFDTQCDFEHVDEDEGYDEDDTMEEVIEDITEQEMLQLLEEQEDSLEVARRLFFCQRPDQVSDQLQILSPDHLESLFQHGVVVIDGLFESSASSCVDDARSVALEMFANGQLQPASMVKENDDPFRDRTARDDWICWLNEYVDDESTSSAFLPLSKIVNTLKTIRSDVSKCMHLRQTSEYQLAYYPASHGNARYERHRDAFPTDDLEDEDQRRVTAICYLNPPDWNASTDGGQLRLHRPQLADIMMDPIVAPLSGRIVLFLSGVIDHEVMSSKRDRFAVTSWIK